MEPRLLRRVLTLLASLVVFGLAAIRFLRVLATTINSDSLYLAGLYRDVFIDKVPIHAWSIQPAPSFFPDLPAFFLLRAITGSAAAATCAYGAFELLVEAALFAAVLRALGLRDRWSAYSAAFFIVAVVAYVTSCRVPPDSLLSVDSQQRGLGRARVRRPGDVAAREGAFPSGWG